MSNMFSILTFDECQLFPAWDQWDHVMVDDHLAIQGWVMPSMGPIWTIDLLEGNICRRFCFQS